MLMHFLKNNYKMIFHSYSFWSITFLSQFSTEEVGDEGEEEKECITYNVSIDIHYGIKSNRYLMNFSIALSFR